MEILTTLDKNHPPSVSPKIENEQPIKHHIIKT